MKVSVNWIKELVDLNVPIEEVIKLLPLRTIGTKEVTGDFIELDMKGYNRADLLSMRGVAQEVAAITDSQVKSKDEEEFVWEGRDLPTIDVDITNEVALVYCAARIEGLKVEQSNETWVKKLSDCGIRSVNNVADITNLVMLEYGQPMHAFDGNTVTRNIHVEGCWDATTQYTTLDHKPKKIEPGDILIRGNGQIIGLGGIMGGENSEVTEKTTSIILEAAIFDPVQIRETAARLGLHSEASKRFQHGLTKKRLLQALDGAIKMYQQLGGKLTAITLVGDLQDKVKTVILRQEKLNSLIGIEIKPEEAESYLQKLGFTLKKQDNGWNVTVPYWRLDIEIEEDLVEEVARIYGYEKIPAKPLEGSLPEKINQSLFETIWSLKKALSEAGLTEVQTYSFYSTDVLNNLNWNRESLVKVANPISSETEYLREDIWPNLLEVVVKNVKQGYSEVAIFEIGKVYSPVIPAKAGIQSTSETYRVSLALANNENNTIQELYRIFQDAISHLRGGIIDITLNTEKEMGEYEQKFFHPARFGYLDSRLRGNDEHVGGVAEVHPRYTDKFGIKQRVAVLEIELDPLLNNG